MSPKVKLLIYVLGRTDIVQDFNKNSFKDLLKLIVGDIFMINDNYYKQHDGVTIGFPLDIT